MTPKSYKCKFIQPGVISYDDKNQGTVLVEKPALDSMASTFRNCPVIFVPEQHNDSNKENSFDFTDLSKNLASGIVTGVPYWGDDGWMWVEFTVWDANAIKAIEKGYSVSCAYIPDKVADGGEWHQIPYDEQVLDGHYIHMAIVARPRYEGSQIFANSKGGHGIMALFGMKKNAEPPVMDKNKEPVQPVQTQPDDGKNKPIMVNADTEVDVGEEKIPLSALVEAYQQNHGQLQDDDEIELEDGSTVSIGDLKKAYGAACTPPAAENADMGSQTPPVLPTQTQKPEDKKTMTNSAPTSKVNQALKNAVHTDGVTIDDGIETEAERLERGRKLYSSAVENGGK